MTEWEEIVENIHHAMQAVEDAHETTQELRTNPNGEALAAFQAQMKQLMERLTKLQTALEHESEYEMDEIADQLAIWFEGKPIPSRKTQKV